MGKQNMPATEIRAIRDRLNLTQAEFADRLGVSQATVSLWEAGERRPTGSAVRLMYMIASEKTVKKLRKSS